MHRRKLELVLAQDALDRGWPREHERHQEMVARIDQLLRDFGSSPPPEEP
jgi:hypothetical protein